MVHFKPTQRLDSEQKLFYPNLQECIFRVKDKLKREGSDYQLTKDDIEMAYEFQTIEVNQRSCN